jgi:hypothetical protein
MGVGHGLFPAEGEGVTLADDRQRYRKLPGRRRGFIFSASLWTAADHLLSVRSDRFQEQYKRFYFRDIQAIVITRVPRYLVSTRALGTGALLLIAILFLRVRAPGLTNWLWLSLALLTAVWIYVCAAHSCTCRLYTAVSREDLPSLYRTWTARKALAELEQRIAQVQGTFTESWAEAADFRPLGPGGAAVQARAGSRRVAMRSRTLASDIFLASIFADAVAVMWNVPAKPLLTGLSAGLTALQLASAIWIFVQHHRGILRTAIQRLAMVALLFIGGVAYVGMLVDSLAAARAGAQRPIVTSSHPLSPRIRPVYSAGLALLAIVGVVLSFKSTEPEPPPVITGQTG